MYYYLKGKATEINDEEVVLESNGIGYKITTLAKDKYELLKEYKIFIYDYLNSEYEPVLYGFKELNDLKFFKILIKISGIGAKTAHSILNNQGSDVIISLIENKDINALKKISGIGQKANMICYELRNKLQDFEVDILKYENVYSALVQMNYNPLEIRTALNNIDQNLSDEDALRESLRRISNARK